MKQYSFTFHSKIFRHAFDWVSKIIWGKDFEEIACVVGQATKQKPSVYWNTTAIMFRERGEIQSWYLVVT